MVKEDKKISTACMYMLAVKIKNKSAVQVKGTEQLSEEVQS